jgi:hypothetical protein
MASWCTSGCIESYSAAVADVQVKCQADRAEVWSTYLSVSQVLAFRQGIWFSKGICTSVSGTYCWPKLSVVASLYATSAGSLTAQVTIDQMNAACSDACVPQALITLGSYGYPTLVAQVKAFEVFCLKIDGTYCRFALNNWAASYTVDASGRPSFSILCQPWYDIISPPLCPVMHMS